MGIKEILEGLDSSIFNEEMVSEVQKLFESAVEEKVKQAKTIVEHNYNKKIEKIEKKHSSLNEDVIKENEKSLSIQKSRANAQLNKIADRYAKKEKLNEKRLEKYKQEVIKEFKEKESKMRKQFFMDKKALQREYAEIFENALKEEVSNFVRENGELFEEALKVSRQKVLQESIKATMKISGNDVEVLSSDRENEKLNREIKKLKEENAKLNESISEYAKKSIFEKVSKGMSVTQKDSLTSLVENISFVDEKQYETRLRALAKNISRSSNSDGTSSIRTTSKGFSLNENSNVKEKDVLRTLPQNKGGIYSKFLG